MNPTLPYPTCTLPYLSFSTHITKIYYPTCTLPSLSYLTYPIQHTMFLYPTLPYLNLSHMYHTLPYAALIYPTLPYLNLSYKNYEPYPSLHVPYPTLTPTLSLSILLFHILSYVYSNLPYITCNLPCPVLPYGVCPKKTHPTLPYPLPDTLWVGIMVNAFCCNM